MYVELLFVPHAVRRLGIGSKLPKAEEIAIEGKCAGIWLDSFSFLAPGF
jgi:hypothetical protein